MPQLSLDSLQCVYFALFFLGVGYALFVVVTGGMSSVDMPDVDIPGVDIGGVDLPAAGIDAPDVSVSPLSPITISTFITTFGGIGVLCLQLFGTSPVMSLVWAMVGALASAGLMFIFYSRFLIGSQASSELRRGELIGMHGEVTVPIGETTPGQVSYRTKSGRMSSMARSVDGKPIPRGQFVKIVRTIGAQALVVPLSIESEDEGNGPSPQGL